MEQSLTEVRLMELDITDVLAGLGQNPANLRLPDPE